MFKRFVFVVLCLFQAPCSGFLRNLLLSENNIDYLSMHCNQSSIFDKLFWSKDLGSKKFLDDSPDLGIKLSHDGKYLSFIGINNSGHQVICISTNLALDVNNSSQIITEKPCKQKKCSQKECGIFKYGWCYNTDYLWYLADSHGDERYALYCVNHKENKIIKLIPSQNSSLRILKLSLNHPNELLVLKNEPGSFWYDVYKINIEFGDFELVYKNYQFIDFCADSNFNLCFATRLNSECEREFFQKQPNGCWQMFDKAPFVDSKTTQILHLTNDGKKLYFKDSRNRDTAALVELNLESGVRTTLATNDKADLCKVLINPDTLEIDAACFTLEKDSWIFLGNFDKPTSSYFCKLRDDYDYQIQVLSRSLDDSQWIVKLETSQKTKLCIYNPKQLLFSKTLGSYEKTFQTSSQIIISRDGHPLVCYLTLPIIQDISLQVPTIPQDKFPMILMVHGGPWCRDYPSVCNAHQNFANQGYAVLSVNYRGSIGFGKNFLNAGIGEWGGKMLDDLLDATAWAIDQNITDPNKIGIYGSSYGGYAALAALTFHPEVFTCGVDLCGPSNLITLLDGLPTDWGPEKEWIRKMLGADERTELGRNFLRSRSPLFFADQITKPLLIGHGTNDPRVKQSESRQIFGSLNDHNLHCLLALFPDEGHCISKQANIDAFSNLTNIFFAKYLKKEDKKTITSTNLRGSSINLFCSINSNLGNIF